MDGLLYIGVDSSGNPRYVKIPSVLNPYKFELSRGLFSGLKSFRGDESYDLVVDNLAKRGLLYKFLEKHMLYFFDSINNDIDVLEAKIKEECEYIYRISNWDDTANRLFENYNKGVSVESMVYRYIYEKLKDYVDRLNSVEF